MKTRLAQWALSVALLLCCVGEAHAFDVYPPVGYAGGRIVVGRKVSDGTIWVNYRRFYVDTFQDCVWVPPGYDHSIGGWTKISDDSGLIDGQVTIHGSSYQDEVLILTGMVSEPMTVCGTQMDIIRQGDILSDMIHVYTWAGDDIVMVENSGFGSGGGPANSAISIHGGDGQDWIVAYNAKYIWGDAGSDSLIGIWMFGGGGSQEVYGGSGDDMFCSYNGAVPFKWAGEGGSDVRFGSATFMTSIEGTVGQGNCDIKYNLAMSRIWD